MIRTPTRTLALLATIAALAAVAAPAHADRIVLNDETGDVWSPEGESDWTSEGSVANTDLRRTWIQHQHLRVTVTAKYVNLKKNVSDEITLHAYLRTDHPRLYDAQVHIDGDGAYTRAILVRPRTGGGPLDCRGLTAKTRFGVDTVRVIVPRSCLRNPGWIRFQGKAQSYSESEGLFIDDAQVSNPKSQYATARPWTKRLERG